MGGIFAVSTALPGKIQHLAYPLETNSRFGTEEAPQASHAQIMRPDCAG
jgi:hypothetical protein